MTPQVLAGKVGVVFGVANKRSIAWAIAKAWAAAGAKLIFNYQGERLKANVEELAGEFAGKLTVAKVNIDDNPMTPNNYAVQGIPTLILFKNGQPAAKQVGALPKSRLKEWISANI